MKDYNFVKNAKLSLEKQLMFSKILVRSQKEFWLGHKGKQTYFEALHYVSVLSLRSHFTPCISMKEVHVIKPGVFNKCSLCQNSFKNMPVSNMVIKTKQNMIQKHVFLSVQTIMFTGCPHLVVLKRDVLVKGLPMFFSKIMRVVIYDWHLYNHNNSRYHIISPRHQS